jgi:hypothetical protein
MSVQTFDHKAQGFLVSFLNGIFQLCIEALFLLGVSLHRQYMESNFTQAEILSIEK